MTERERTVQEIRHLLQRRASPRLHMLMLVMVTAMVGLVSSFLLLKAGVTMMVVRYPLAVTLAYFSFLVLVSLWLRRFRLRERKRDTSDSVAFDLVEVPLDAMWSPAGGPSSPRFGGGGGFSGGGSSGTWNGYEPAQPRIAPILVTQTSSSPASGSSDSGWSFDLDSDTWWLLLAGLIAAVAFSILLYVVWIAPTLFAELLVDAGLAAGLYRRLATIERRTWLATAVRNTIIPAAAIATLLGVSGLIIQAVYPDAVSIGRVVDRMKESPITQPSDR